jgi:hypothetical protein
MTTVMGMVEGKGKGGREKRRSERGTESREKWRAES